MTKIKYLEPQHFYYRDVYDVKRTNTGFGWKDVRVYAAIDHSKNTVPRELPYNPAYILTDNRRFRKVLLKFAKENPDKVDIESDSVRVLRMSVAREHLADLIKEAKNETGKDTAGTGDRTDSPERNKEGLPA